MNAPPVNITVVTCGRLELTRRCLDSLFKRTPGGLYALTVVDNASTDGTVEYLRGLEAEGRIQTLRLLERNMGVAVASNLGWAGREAEYFLKLDNDVEIRDPEWLDALVNLAARNPELGMVGHKLLDRHRTVIDRLSGGDEYARFPGCGGGCALVPARTHAVLGFWNEDYGRYGFEDLEYGNRAMLAGFAVGYAPREGMAAHLGYEGEVDRDMEERKAKNVAGRQAGQEMYLLNTFMFESGLRDLYVSRKYAPETRQGRLAFRLDPAYREIMRRQKDLRARVDFQVKGDTVEIDLSRFKADRL